MQQTDQPTLKALVLAGGESRRMGQDKAAIQVDGVSLLSRTVSLARQFVDDVHVSVRTPPVDETRRRFNCIVDAGVGQGPLDGILTALNSDTSAAWLVLACDLPLLDASTLRVLIDGAAQHPVAPAIAVADSSGELPEPLCAIWRAPMRAHIEAAFADGRFCARKCLINADAVLVTPVNPDALLNMNQDADLRLAARHGVIIG
ncbi:MAG: molybdenum cofactor guanylyltransferase [Pseudomonadota bacterium]